MVLSDLLYLTKDEIIASISVAFQSGTESPFDLCDQEVERILVCIRQRGRKKPVQKSSYSDLILKNPYIHVEDKKEDQDLIAIAPGVVFRCPMCKSYTTAISNQTLTLLVCPKCGWSTPLWVRDKGNRE